MTMPRMRLAIIDPMPPYADVGPFEAVLEQHPYLHHDPCGERVYAGRTTTGALIFGCLTCKQIVDARRVP